MTGERPGRADELARGSRLGDYQIDSVLGQGGMGVVYKATDTATGDTVALKVLKTELARQEPFRKRFAHEARAAAAVRHRHLVRVRAAGESDGALFLAMDYVDGMSLEQRIRAGAMPLEAAASVLVDIASGLDALHQCGIVHRDIKTANVLLDRESRASLTDFGLARRDDYTVITATGQLLGSLEYLAPEFIRGSPASPATDIYALGCVAYACITGRTPFRGRTAFEVGLAHLQKIPPDPRGARPELTHEGASALLRALAKEPAGRPSTATEYAQLVRRALL